MNKQKWKKKGLFFEPDKNFYWQNSHAAIPTSIHINHKIVRTYFNSRDQNNKAYIGFFDWEIQSKKIVFRAKTPVLIPGEYGMFDDHGVQVTSVVRIEQQIYLYYLGWNPSATKPLFYTSIGLAISTDNGATFKKYSDAPIMQRSKYDPWMVSGGTVIREGKTWRMYYLSGQKMIIKDKNVTSFYDIKYAESSDGINWERNGITCLSLRKDETNISRLSILKEDIYKAWYPYKKKDSNYTIGYAESIDGIFWERKDNEVDISLSESGWDSLALDKVEVIQGLNEKIMLYNGNNFGYDGIGLALLNQE